MAGQINKQKWIFSEKKVIYSNIYSVKDLTWFFFLQHVKGMLSGIQIRWLTWPGKKFLALKTSFVLTVCLASLSNCRKKCFPLSLEAFPELELLRCFETPHSSFCFLYQQLHHRWNWVTQYPRGNHTEQKPWIMVIFWPDIKICRSSLYHNWLLLEQPFVNIGYVNCVLCPFSYLAPIKIFRLKWYVSRPVLLK